MTAPQPYVGKLHRKIDLYVQVGKTDAYRYACTTQQSSTCKAAKARFLELNPQFKAEQVHAGFA